MRKIAKLILRIVFGTAFVLLAAVPMVLGFVVRIMTDGFKAGGYNMKIDFALPHFLNVWTKLFRSKRVPIKRKREKTGRNEICPCGSLMKYKYCCLLKIQNQEQGQMAAIHKMQQKIKGKRHKARGVV